MREILYRAKPLYAHTLLDSKDGFVYGVPVRIKMDASMTDRYEMVSCHAYDELDNYELLSGSAPICKRKMPYCLHPQ